MSEFYALIIAGGRDFKDYGRVCIKVQQIAQEVNKPLVIVTGGAQGADAIGSQVARALGYDLWEFPADWDRYGKRAGPIRNARMAAVADGLLAYWDGRSRGTGNMVGAMRRLGKRVWLEWY